MKKLIAMLLVGTLAVSLAACAQPAQTAQPAAEETAEAAEDEAAVEEAAEEAAEATEAPEEATEAAEETEAAAQESAEAAPAEGKGDGVMTYEEYVAADLDTEVVVETYVQAKQSWWEDKATLYTQDEDGAYFIYNVACTEEDYEKLVPGQKIKVTGFKSEWSGEVEIVDGTFEIEEGNFIAEPVDVTELLGKDELIDYQNQRVTFKGMTVEAAGQDDDGKDVPFLYNWDGSGERGNDLYFKVSLGDEVYSFTVESYLCDENSDVYQAVEALQIGDVIDMEGFLYWYEGVNPHITAVTAAE